MASMQNFRLRVMREADLPQVRELNNAASPAISPLSEEELAALFEMCDVRLVSTDRNHQLLAFMLSMGTGQPHTSENYQWFEARGVRHQYIDRIVVSPTARNLGIGAALYAAVEHHIAGTPWLLCEVNLRPRNETSLRFHERLGFREVGQQDTDGGAKRVSLLALPLPTDAAGQLGG